MVSNASDDLPDPDKPVKTISLSRGNSRVRFLRLCSRAPRMRIVSVDTETPPVDSACLVNDASVVQVGGERMFDPILSGGHLEHPITLDHLPSSDRCAQTG